MLSIKTVSLISYLFNNALGIEKQSKLYSSILFCANSLAIFVNLFLFKLSNASLESASTLIVVILPLILNLTSKLISFNISFTSLPFNEINLSVILTGSVFSVALLSKPYKYILNSFFLLIITPIIYVLFIKNIVFKFSV